MTIAAVNQILGLDNMDFIEIVENDFSYSTSWAASLSYDPAVFSQFIKGGLAMKSSNYMIVLSIMFFVFAAAFSVVFWSEVSLAAKIGLFVLGFGSGVTAGQWFAKRS